MQISRVYCNRADVFTPIDFNYGDDADRLNVVLGDVRRPRDKKRDSHNLGKTTLLHLLDFMMLKGLSNEHFLSKHQDRFIEFIFYIEIALNSGDFATIRRSAAYPTRIALTRHIDGHQDLAECADPDWAHVDLSTDEAIKLLDAWLDLRVLKPYDYRKAITYFLRSQGDWSDELSLQKFQIGKDLYWKPFVAHLFDFKENLIIRKYEIDEAIQKLKVKQADQQSEIQFKEEQLPGLKAELAVLQQQVDDLEEQLDSFQFDAEERRIVSELVETVETEIANLNQIIYDIRYDIRQIDNSLIHKDKFDIKKVEAIYKEAHVNFPGLLKRQYEELVTFKKSVTKERNAALKVRRATLSKEQQAAEERKGVLDRRREEQLRILRNTDTFDKFKSLQRILTVQRAELVYLVQQHSKLESMAETARLVRENERERGRIVDEMKTMVARPTAVFEKFSKTFNEYCQRVLNHEGIFFFFVNGGGNLDYEINLGLAGQKGKASSQSEGTSYKKLVCALFDLALLKTYEDAPFFHFVYHDGVFEALDDRKKIAFLELVREQTASKKIQYIMTVIASDLPRTELGKVLTFIDDEVVLRLHDDGPKGRLFKMGEF